MVSRDVQESLPELNAMDVERADVLRTRENERLDR